MMKRVIVKNPNRPDATGTRPAVTGTCCGNQTYWQKLKNATIGWFVVLFNIKFALATKEEIERRKDICRDCEFSTKHPTAKTKDGKPLVGICLKCKCPIGIKAQRKKAKCPIDKWKLPH